MKVSHFKLCLSMLMMESNTSLLDNYSLLWMEICFLVTSVHQPCSTRVSQNVSSVTFNLYCLFFLIWGWRWVDIGCYLLSCLFLGFEALVSERYTCSIFLMISHKSLTFALGVCFILLQMIHIEIGSNYII